jgi:hypothetical protein
MGQVRVKRIADLRLYILDLRFQIELSQTYAIQQSAIDNLQSEIIGTPADSRAKKSGST